jgi:hypothetical protein
MKEKHNEPERKAPTMENTMRDFGVKPGENKREEIHKQLLGEKGKFLAIERVHGKGVDRDLSR